MCFGERERERAAGEAQCMIFQKGRTKYNSTHLHKVQQTFEELFS